MFLYFPNLATSSTIKMKKKRKWHLQKRSDFFLIKILKSAISYGIFNKSNKTFNDL